MMGKPQQDAQMEDMEHLDNEIMELVNQIRDHQGVISENEDAVHNLKKRLAILLETRGSNWSDDSGYARLVSSGTRIYYDNEALDALIIQNPLHYGWLKDYRRESTVTGRVQVK